MIISKTISRSCVRSLHRGQRSKLLACRSSGPTGKTSCPWDRSLFGAHFIGAALRRHGHDVRRIPAQFVKPFVKSNKNDFIDAEAIAEAVTRQSMRFVPIKTDDTPLRFIQPNCSRRSFSCQGQRSAHVGKKYMPHMRHTRASH